MAFDLLWPWIYHVADRFSPTDEFDRTTLELFAVNESIPELEENFEIVLSAPEGGAKLGPINKRTIKILPNDSPYGLVTIMPHEIKEEEDTHEVRYNLDAN